MSLHDALMEGMPKHPKKGGFKKLEHELARRKGVKNPAALAAWIKDRKYGKSWRTEGK